MQLVPIPTTLDHVEASVQHWAPFLPQITKRSREPLESLVKQILDLEVQVILAWDDERKQARALAGVRYVQRGDDRIAELIWMTGFDRKAWQGLLPILETFLRDHAKCAEVRAIARPGWSKLLKSHGYRMTHIAVEKPL